MKKLIVTAAFLLFGYIGVNAQGPATAKPAAVSTPAPTAVIAADVADAPAPVAKETDATAKKKDKASCDSNKSKSCAGHDKKACCSSKASTTKTEAAKKEDNK